jgi:hypothetical protein
MSKGQRHAGARPAGGAAAHGIDHDHQGARRAADDRVLGWGNLAVVDGGLRAEVGYMGSAPREPEFRRGLEAELERMRTFLRLDTAGTGSEMG